MDIENLRADLWWALATYSCRTKPSETSREDPHAVARPPPRCLVAVAVTLRALALPLLALALEFALACSSAPEAPRPASQEVAPLSAADRPAYASPQALCAYLNDARAAGDEHRRYRGVPWRGEYHDTRTWSVRFQADARLDREAQAEAERLAQGGEPRGKKHRDSSWRRPIWVDGVDSARHQIAAEDVPGDWDPARDVELRTALVQTNGALRMALLHHDPGGEGPVLTHMGCGEATTAADGHARWWVILLGP